MSHKVIAPLLLVFLLAACSGGAGSGSTDARLNGVYAGIVSANNWEVGAIGIDVTTSGTKLAGIACFLGLDGTEACNSLSGNVQGQQVNFVVGGLTFDGTTDGSYIDTRFHSTRVSGFVYFERYQPSNLSALAGEPEKTTAAVGEARKVVDGFLGF